MNQPKSVVQAAIPTPGHDALWEWFGLSYASFLTMPRVMMHEMPDEWQAKMAELCSEWDETWTNQPDISASVQFKRGHKFIAAPKWILNYRHPDLEAINELRGAEVTEFKRGEEG